MQGRRLGTNGSQRWQNGSIRGAKLILSNFCADGRRLWRKRSAGLNKLVDAWEPLYQSLNPDQKQRLRLAAMDVLHEVRGAVERRRMEMMESEEDDVE